MVGEKSLGTLGLLQGVEELEFCFGKLWFL